MRTIAFEEIADDILIVLVMFSTSGMYVNSWVGLWRGVVPLAMSYQLDTSS